MVGPIVRAMKITRLLASAAHGLTMGDIAKRLKMPMSTVHRVLVVLEEQDLVVRSPSDRRYILGSAARELSTMISAHRCEFRDEVTRILAEARAATGETVFLSELVDSSLICMASAESPEMLRVCMSPGARIPFPASPSARAVLAWRDRTAVETLHRTAQSALIAGIATTSATHERLAAIRERGFDAEESELAPGVWSVAAPTRSINRSVVGSVALACPSHRRQSDVWRAEAIEVILACSRDVSDVRRRAG